jgi:hypothetical protein
MVAPEYRIVLSRLGSIRDPALKVGKLSLSGKAYYQLHGIRIDTHLDSLMSWTVFAHP